MILKLYYQIKKLIYYRLEFKCSNNVEANQYLRSKAEELRHLIEIIKTGSSS